LRKKAGAHFLFSYPELRLLVTSLSIQLSGILCRLLHASGVRKETNKIPQGVLGYHPTDNPAKNDGLT
uniref:hypothetical protein n=1 Tax=Nitrosomonas sp. TaxID=42353 RepID=UPI0033064EE1